VHSTRCTVQDAKYKVHRTRCTVQGAQYKVHSTRYTVKGLIHIRESKHEHSEINRFDYNFISKTKQQMCELPRPIVQYIYIYIYIYICCCFGLYFTNSFTFLTVWRYRLTPYRRNVTRLCVSNLSHKQTFDPVSFASRTNRNGEKINQFSTKKLNKP
jgi:hypothetical protein